MKTTFRHLVLISSLFGIGCSTTVTPSSQSSSQCRLEPSPAVHRDYRDKRYCEILVIQGVGPKLTGCVYNTLCDNDCPAEPWNALNAEQLKKEFNATEIVLNGPRHFIMDVFSITTASEQRVSFDGLVMCPAAAMDLEPGSLLPGQRQKPFTETTIDRTTEYVYFKDRPIFLLLSPDNAAYIMQSYSQIVDPRLSYGGLPTLGQHMPLPPGWRYVPVTPQSNLTVKSHGAAHVLQDELQNTYQRLGTEEWATIRELVH